MLFGASCLALERYFYSYVDEHGVLQESLLMPIGAFSLLISVFSLAMLLLVHIWRRLRQHGS